MLREPASDADEELLNGLEGTGIVGLGEVARDVGDCEVTIVREKRVRSEEGARGNATNP